MRKLTILGGHRDGDVVESVGPTLRLPVPTPLRYIAADAAKLPEPGDFPPIDYFRAQQDDDGRWWYVREGRE